MIFKKSSNIAHCVFGILNLNKKFLTNSSFFKLLWKQKTKEEYNDWCKNMSWTKDRHETHKKYMKERHSNQEFKEKFNNIMKTVNANPEKIKKTSKALKEKWKNPEFALKMKNRKHGNNSSTLKEKWKNPEWRRNMLESRKKGKKNETNESN